MSMRYVLPALLVAVVTLSAGAANPNPNGYYSVFGRTHLRTEGGFLVSREDFTAAMRLNGSGLTLNGRSTEPGVYNLTLNAPYEAENTGKTQFTFTGTITVNFFAGGTTFIVRKGFITFKLTRNGVIRFNAKALSIGDDNPFEDFRLRSKFKGIHARNRQGW